MRSTKPTKKAGRRLSRGKVKCIRTGIIIENGSDIDFSGMEIEDADTMYPLSPHVQSGHDVMGWIIIEDHGKDDTKKAAEEKHDTPKSADQRWLTRQERRCEKKERDKAAATKAKTKTIMEENHLVRRRTQHRWKQGLTSSRRPVVSEAK